jgi:ABC-type transport system substrate-binding protein
MRAVQILLGVIAVLLLVIVIDRARTTDQLSSLNQTLQRLQASADQQTQEAKATRQALESRPAVSAAVGTATPPAEAPGTSADRDGNPKLGVNFLLPYDRSYFHPEWLHGVTKGFDSTPKGCNLILENSATISDLYDRVSDQLCQHWPETPTKWTESLATSVVISDDFKVYTCTIRDGVKWQRPQIAKQPEFKWLDKDVPLTSKDFAFYIELVLNPDVDCAYLRNYFEDIVKVETPDDRTLRITWKKKNYESLAVVLGLNPMPRHIYAFNRDGTPIPKDQVGVTFNKHWFDELRQVVGVGPYILTAFEPDKIISFRRNPDYWGAPFHFEGMDWLLDVKNPDAQLVAFKNGQVHGYGLTPAQFKAQIVDHKEPRFAADDDANPKAGRDGELGWAKIQRNAYFYIGWNLRLPMFQDQRVRQALAYAFPKQRILKEVYYGLRKPTETALHPDHPEMEGLNLAPYTFDLDKARALLAEAGWTDSDGDGWLDKEINGQRVPFRFLIKYYDNAPDWDNTLLIYKNELKKIGIDMNAEPKEWKELLRVHEEHDFDAMVGAWLEGDLTVDFYQIWHSSQVDQPNSSNVIGFKNARVDELEDRLRSTFDAGERRKIIQEVLTIFHDEQPYLFISAAAGVGCWQNKGPPMKDQYLEGMGETLDRSNPLYNRGKVLYRIWQHFRE